MVCSLETPKTTFRILEIIMKNFLFFALAVLLIETASAQDYYVYVNAESEDEVALIKFDGERAEVAKTIEVGTWPNEIEGFLRSSVT